MNFKSINVIFKGLFVLGIVVSLAQCRNASVSEWDATNQQLITEHNLAVRELTDLPANDIVSNLEVGKPKNISNLETIELYPGVSAKIFWGNGTMVSVIEMAPNSEIPEEILNVDQFVFVQGGFIDKLIDGNAVTLTNIQREEPDGTHSLTPKTEFVYLQKGT